MTTKKDWSEDWSEEFEIVSDPWDDELYNCCYWYGQDMLDRKYQQVEISDYDGDEKDNYSFVAKKGGRIVFCYKIHGSCSYEYF